MKKLFGLILFLLLASSVTFASEWRYGYYNAEVSDSGGATVTVNISAASGVKPIIHKIIGTSDLSTSIIQIQEADAAGTTTNYTTIMKLNCGDATVEYGDGTPVFVGKVNYGYQFLLDSTTANSLIVTYTKE